MAHRIVIFRAASSARRWTLRNGSLITIVENNSSSLSSSFSSLSLFTTISQEQFSSSNNLPFNPSSHQIKSFSTTLEPKSESESASDSDSETPDYLGPNAKEWDQRTNLSEFEPGEEIPYVTLPPLPNDDDETGSEAATLASPELHALADQIINMKFKHVVKLTNLVQDHFGFEDHEDDYGGSTAGATGGEAGGGDSQPAEEKTAFDLKLTGFDAKSKIKVIKEVRAITGLGLKEAKELVEKAPKVMKKDLKQEEAEELKAKLEAVGATVEVE